MFNALDEDVVLIVDDVPENLSLLHDALDEAGYTVLVATNGDSALQIARKRRPDVILLDVLMPGPDGYETAQSLKAEFNTQNIPIIFMTGLTETENVVAAFASGGADYVTKPIKPQEVLARIAAHMKNARQIKQARRLLSKYFDIVTDPAPEGRLFWIVKARKAALEGREAPIVMEKDASRLLGNLHDPGNEAECLLTLREESCAAVVNSLIEAFHLTMREAEVLYWVIYGKTNRDIGDILGSSHRTVNKHLEHIFEKLGVETRTSAAAVAMQRLRING